MNTEQDELAMTTAQRIARIVWPAFLAAGAMEVVVFAFVDPNDLHWGAKLLDIQPAGIYTVAFFVFWAIATASSWLTVALSAPCRSLNSQAKPGRDAAG